MSVVCLDWYETGGSGDHIHVEAFVQDQGGNRVVGAMVTLENTVDGVVYQLMTSTTNKYKGYNHGESCPLSVAQASGATGQYCCVGSSCASGLYESLVLAVDPPAGSNLVWDGATPPNGYNFLRP